MKEKFIEWFTAGNSGYAPAIDADGKFEKEKTQHMWEAYQAGLASAEAQVKQLAAENAALKAFGDKLYSMYKGLETSGGGFHDDQSISYQQAALDAAMSAFEEIETPATDSILASLRA